MAQTSDLSPTVLRQDLGTSLNGPSVDRSMLTSVVSAEQEVCEF